MLFFSSFWVYLLGNELKREERSLQSVPVVLKSTGDAWRVQYNPTVNVNLTKKTKEHPNDFTQMIDIDNVVYND